MAIFDAGQKKPASFSDTGFIQEFFAVSLPEKSWVQ